MRDLPVYDLRVRELMARQATVKTSKLRWALLLAFAALLPCGCGKPTGTVDGTVTYSGKPVTVGWVSFRDLPKGFVAAMKTGSGWDLPAAVQRRPGHPRGRVCRHSQPPGPDRCRDQHPPISQVSEPSGEVSRAIHVATQGDRQAGEESVRYQVANGEMKSS